MAYMVSNIATKVLKRDAEDEQLTFSIKVDVTNKSDDDEVYVTLQGIDAEGFEVYSVAINGKIPCQTTKTLTTKEEYVDFSEFDLIVSWQLGG